MNFVESTYIYWEQHYSKNDKRYDAATHATIILSAILFTNSIFIIQIIGGSLFHVNVLEPAFNLLGSNGVIRRFFTIPIYYSPFFVFCYWNYGKRKRHWEIKRKYFEQSEDEKKKIRKTGIIITVLTLLFMFIMIFSPLIK